MGVSIGACGVDAAKHSVAPCKKIAISCRSPHVYGHSYRVKDGQTKVHSCGSLDGAHAGA